MSWKSSSSLISSLNGKISSDFSEHKIDLERLVLEEIKPM